jgi:hypothetical protein
MQGIISGYPGRTASLFFIALTLCICFAVVYSGFRNRSASGKKASVEQLIGFSLIGCMMIGMMVWQIIKHSPK